PVRSVLQPQVAGLGELRPVRLRVGDEISLDDVVDQLAAAAYTRVDLVERRGEFAVRGGIVDVFPPTEEHPVRVDFWGDTVDEIRWFTVADQRSTDLVESGLWAPPCRELLLTDDVRERAAKLSSELPELAEMLDKIAAGIAVEGMESLAPVLVDRMEMLIDLLPEGTQVLVCDPERVRTRAHDLVSTSQEFLDASWAAAAGGGTSPIDLGAAAYRTLGDVRSQALRPGPRGWSRRSVGLDAAAAGNAGPGQSEPGGRDAGAAAYRTLGDVRSQALRQGLRWWSLSSLSLDAAAAGNAEPAKREPVDLDADLYAVDLGDDMVHAGAVESRQIDARPAETY